MLEALLSLIKVRERVPYSKVHIYRMMKVGLFPRQVRIGPNRVAWRASDIQRWIEGKISALATE